MYHQPYNQKLSPLWWTKKVTYFVYFLREFTGIVIAAYVFYVLFLTLLIKLTPAESAQNSYYFDSFFNFGSFAIVSWIALAFALFHMLTWLYVSAKIAPRKIGGIKILKVPVLVKFGGLLAVWLLISNLLLSYFYV